jgi:hypothetical protein
VDPPEAPVTAWTIPALLLLAIAACGDPGDGRALHHDAILALRAGDIVAAEILAERAAASGGPAVVASSEVVLGCAAFARCERKALEFFGPAGGPATIDAAIVHAERALDLWRRAAARTGTGAEARRNAERALLKLAALWKLRSEAESKPASPPKPRPVPVGVNPSDAPPQPGAARREPPPPRSEVGEIPAGRVLGLLDRLTEKEREKLRARRAARQAGRASVETDW